MLQRHTLINICVAVVIVIIALGMATKEAAIENTVPKDTYVRGLYGKHCYLKGLEHPNITRPVYFDSLEECNSYGK